MHIPALDGLRFLAAYIVFFAHFANQTGLLGSLPSGGSGRIGVMIFFMLSGFLLGHLYIEDKCDWRNARKYVANRIARVVPLFYVVVVVSIVATSLGQPSFLYDISGQSTIEHLLFVNGKSVLWTVPIELQFYAAFIGVWALYQIDRTKTVVGLLVVMFGVFFFYPALPPKLLPLLTYLHVFLCGLVLSIVARALERRKANDDLPLWVADFGFLLGLLLIPLCLPMVHHHLVGTKLINFGWGELKIALVCALLLLATTQSNIANRVLGSPTMRIAGSLSYSIYLLHYPILLGLKAAIGSEDFLVLFVACNVAMLVLSTASLWLIENPARRAIRRWLANDKFVVATTPRRPAEQASGDQSPAPSEA